MRKRNVNQMANAKQLAKVSNLLHSLNTELPSRLLVENEGMKKGNSVPSVRPNGSQNSSTTITCMSDVSACKTPHCNPKAQKCSYTSVTSVLLG